MVSIWLNSKCRFNLWYTFKTIIKKSYCWLLITISRQRHIQKSVKNLRWSFFGGWLIDESCYLFSQSLCKIIYGPPNKNNIINKSIYINICLTFCNRDASSSIRLMFSFLIVSVTKYHVPWSFDKIHSILKFVFQNIFYQVELSLWSCI